MPELSVLSSRIELDVKDAERGLTQFRKSWSDTESSVKTGFAAGAGFAAFQAGLVVIEKGFGAVKGAAFNMNATLETSTSQFAVLMGSADQAQRHVAGLFEYAKETPFETGPIIEASRLMETFGGSALNTQKNIRLLGDASAGSGAPINELGFWVGRLYSNLQGGQPFGEAAMRLQELAVMSPQARSEMERLQKAGASADDIFRVLQADLAKFTGATQLQAKSWAGLTSTFTDSLNMLASQALRPLFDVSKDLLGAINNLIGSDAAAAWAQRFADGLTATVYAAKQLILAARDLPIIGGWIAGIVDWFGSLAPAADAAGQEVEKVDQALALPQGQAGLMAAGTNMQALQGFAKDAEGIVKDLDRQLREVDKSSRAIKNTVEDVQRAYEEQTRPLEDQIKSLKERRDFQREEKTLVNDLQLLEIRRAEEVARGDRAIRTRLDNQLRELDAVRDILSLQQRREDIEERLRNPSGKSAAEQRLAELNAQERLIRMREREEDLLKRAAKGDKGAREELAAFQREKERFGLETQIAREREEADQRRAERQRQLDLVELASINRRLTLAEQIDQQALSALNTARSQVQAQQDALSFAEQRERIEGRIAALPLEQQLVTLRSEQEAVLKPLQEQLDTLERQREELQGAKSDWTAIKDEMAAAIKLQKEAGQLPPSLSAPKGDVSTILGEKNAQETTARERGEALGQALLDSFSGWFQTKVQTFDLGGWIRERVEAVDWASVWSTTRDTATAFWNGAVDLGGRFLTWAGEQLGAIDWSTVWTNASTTATEWWATVTDLAGRFVTWAGQQVGSIDWQQVWQSITTGATAWWEWTTDLAGRFVTWAGQQVAAVDWGKVWQGIADTATAFWKWSNKIAVDFQGWLREQASQINWDEVWKDAQGFNESAGNWLSTQWQNLDWEKVYQAINSGSEAFTASMRSFIKGLPWGEFGELAANALLGAFVLVKEKLPRAVGEAVFGALKGGLLKLPLDLLNGITDLALRFIGRIAEAITSSEGWKNASQAMLSGMTAIANSVNGTLNPAVAKPLEDGGKSWVDGIVTGLRNRSQTLNTEAASVGRQSVDAINAELGVKSPADALIPTGEAIVAGVAAGIVAAAGGTILTDAVQTLSDALMRAFGGTVGTVNVGQTAAPAAAGSLTETAYQLGLNLLTSFQNGLTLAWDGAADQIGVRGWFEGLGQQILIAIDTGMLAAFSTLGGGAGSTVTGAASGAASAAGQAGSGAMMLLMPIGQQLMQGMLNGLMLGFGSVDGEQDIQSQGTEQTDQTIQTVMGWFQQTFGPEGTLATSLLALQPQMALVSIGQQLAQGIKSGLEIGFFSLLGQGGPNLSEAAAQALQAGVGQGGQGGGQAQQQVMSIMDWFTQLLGPEGTLVTSLRELNPMQTLVPIGQDLMAGLLNGLIAGWTGAGAAAGAVAGNALAQAGGEAVLGVLPWLKALPGQIVLALDSDEMPAIDVLYPVGWDFMSGLWDGAIDEWLIQQVWWGLIGYNIENAVLMGGALYMMQDLGKRIMSYFGRGAEDEWNARVIVFFRRMGEEIRRESDSWPPQELLAPAGKQLMEGLTRAIEDGSKQVLDKVRDLGRQIKQAMEGVVGQFEEAAEKANEAAAQIESAAGRATAAAQQMQSAFLSISSFSFGGFSGGGGGFTGFAAGGILREPVVGYGLRSGRGYTFAEQGPEAIVPMSMRGSGLSGSAGGGGGNTYITNQVFVTVQGSVQAERDLAKTVRDELVRFQGRNVSTGLR